jgi:hypothetical protein
MPTLFPSTVEAIVGLGVQVPAETAKTDPVATGRAFLAKHPQLWEQIELVMFHSARELGMGREQIALVLNQTIPMFVKLLAGEAAKLKSGAGEAGPGLGR